MMSSSDVSQPPAARAFLAAAGLSTTIRIASRPSAAGAMKPMMFTFFAPKAEATLPNIPGRSSTHTLSCFAFGMVLSLH